AVANTPASHSEQGESSSDPLSSGIVKRNKRRRDKNRAEREDTVSSESHSTAPVHPGRNISSGIGEIGSRERTDASTGIAVEHVRIGDRDPSDTKSRVAKEPQLPLGIEQLSSSPG